MSYVIKLLNLPWSASSADVRSFFSDFYIPNGGVRIIGGDDGQCFVVFNTIKDVEDALRKDGHWISDQRVSLYNSSEEEMQYNTAVAKGEIPPIPFKQRNQSPRNNFIQENGNSGRSGSRGDFYSDSNYQDLSSKDRRWQDGDRGNRPDHFPSNFGRRENDNPTKSRSGRNWNESEMHGNRKTRDFNPYGDRPDGPLKDDFIGRNNDRSRGANPLRQSNIQSGPRGPPSRSHDRNGRSPDNLPQLIRNNPQDKVFPESTKNSGSHPQHSRIFPNEPEYGAPDRQDNMRHGGFNLHRQDRNKPSFQDNHTGFQERHTGFQDRYPSFQDRHLGNSNNSSIPPLIPTAMVPARKQSSAPLLPTPLMPPGDDQYPPSGDSMSRGRQQNNSHRHEIDRSLRGNGVHQFPSQNTVDDPCAVITELPSDVKFKQLRGLFATHSINADNIVIRWHEHTGQPTRAHVLFDDLPNTILALNELKGMKVGGRQIDIHPCSMQEYRYNLEESQTDANRSRRNMGPDGTPFNRPPGDNPPFNRPPGDNPPFDRPPGDRLPFERPPFDGPPFDRPLFDRPPNDRLPADRPPFDRQPFDRPPFDRPLFDRPPGDRPPFDRPPGDYRGESPMFHQRDSGPTMRNNFQERREPPWRRFPERRARSRSPPRNRFNRNGSPERPRRNRSRSPRDAPRRRSRDVNRNSRDEHQETSGKETLNRHSNNSGGKPPAPDDKSSWCVAITGLPPKTSVKDLEDLLKDYKYNNKSLYIEINVHNECTGTAYVEMSSQADQTHLVSAQKEMFKQSLHSSAISKVQMENYVAQHQTQLAADTTVPGEFTLQLIGLPFESTPQTVKEFLYPAKIKDADVTIVKRTDGTGRCSGNAFALVHSKEDRDESLKHDRGYIGKRYVCVKVVSKHFMEDFLKKQEILEAENAAQLESDPDICRTVNMVNLRYDLKPEQIEAFFCDFGPEPGSVKFIMNNGMPTGRGSIRLNSAENVENAVNCLRNKDLAGRSIILSSAAASL